MTATVLTSVLRGILGTTAFFFKEVLTVLHQPRLIVSLVLGPFLILLLFGLGFRGQRPELQTIIVLPPDDRLAGEVERYRQAFSGVFQVQDVLRDERLAMQRLASGQTDVVIIVPPDALQRLGSGQQATLEVLYREIDPVQSAWVQYFSYVQTTELNRRLLAELIRQSKSPAAQLSEYARQASETLGALEADVRRGDDVSARARVGALLAATEAARSGAAQALDPFGAGDSNASASELLGGSAQELRALDADLARGDAGRAAALERIQRMRQSNEQLRMLADRLATIPPETLVSPFVDETRNIVPVEPTEIAYYSPAVLALLLQHMGVTLTALSLVRDRLLGALDLVRVSPAGVSNVLIGKTLGFACLLGVVAIALSLAATTLLGVPSLGDQRFYWLSVALTVFAAVGLGFTLALLARTESQAVQLSMLVLLTSVFFGGFVLPLEQLFPWVRSVSYVLPVTYGTINLREVMLRGGIPPLLMLLGPLALGLLFFTIATVGLRRDLRRA